MCNIDWTALGTWLQALVVLGAAIIAWFQLTAFIRSDRIKQTIDRLDRFAADGHADFLNGIITDPSLIQSGRRLNIEYARSTPEERRTFDFKFMKILNYFDELNTLYQRKIIDRELVMHQFDELIISAFICLSQYTSNYKNTPQLPGFRQLAREAQFKYMFRGGPNQECLTYSI